MPIKDLYKFLSIALIVLVLILAGYVYVFSKIKDRNQQAAQMLADIQAESVREAKLKTLKETVSQTAELREDLEKYVLGEDQTVLLIEDIESLGPELGMEVSIQSVQLEPHQSERFEWVTFAIAASGGWNDVMRLISLIETLPYRTEVENFVLEERTEQDVSLGWQSRMILKVLKVK